MSTDQAAPAIPTSVDLTAAARYIIDLAEWTDRPGGVLPAAVLVWCHLTGVKDADDALELARTIAAGHPAPLLAYLPPM